MAHGHQTTPEAPWLGLEPFEESDQAYYFGRTDECAELTRRASRRHCTVLFGRSGLGKTSLLRAGVFPTLRSMNVLPIYIRLSDVMTLNPVEQVRARLNAELRRAADAGAIDPVAPIGEQSLWLYFRETPLWSPASQLIRPLLVFDQFEEIFASVRQRHDTEPLLVQLTDLVEDRIPRSLRLADSPSLSTDPAPRPHILFALREDNLADIDDLTRRAPSLRNNRLRLRPMTMAQGLEAIVKPGSLRDGEPIITAAHAEQILATIAIGERVDPPLLSLICRRLNDQRLAAGQSQIAAESLGQRTEHILREFYDEAVATVAPATRRFVEDHLVTPSGHRTAVAIEVAEQHHSVPGADLERLIDARIVRTAEQPPDHVELVHDVLVPVTRASRTERLQAEAAERHARELEAQAAEAQRLLRRRLAIGAMVLLALIAAAAVWVWLARQTLENDLREQQARESARRKLELSRRLSGQGYVLLASEMAQEAARTADMTGEVDGARIALLAHHFEDQSLGLQRLSTDASPRSLAFGDSGRFAVAAYADFTHVWDLTGAEPRCDLVISAADDPRLYGPDCRHSLSVVGPDMFRTATWPQSPDPTHLRLAVATDQRVYVWERTAEGSWSAVGSPVPYRHRAESITASPGGDRLLIIPRSSQVNPFEIQLAKDGPVPPVLDDSETAPKRRSGPNTLLLTLEFGTVEMTDAGEAVLIPDTDHATGRPQSLGIIGEAPIEMPLAAALSADGGCVGLANRSGRIALWHVGPTALTFAKFARLPLTGAVQLDVTQGCRRVLAGGTGGVFIWERDGDDGQNPLMTSDLRLSPQWQTDHPGRWAAAALSADGRSVALTDGWHIAQRQDDDGAETFWSADRAVHSLSLSGTGEQLAVATDSHLWWYEADNTRSNRVLRTVRGRATFATLNASGTALGYGLASDQGTARFQRRNGANSPAGPLVKATPWRLSQVAFDPAPDPVEPFRDGLAIGWSRIGNRLPVWRHDIEDNPYVGYSRPQSDLGGGDLESTNLEVGFSRSGHYLWQFGQSGASLWPGPALLYDTTFGRWPTYREVRLRPAAWVAESGIVAAGIDEREAPDRLVLTLLRSVDGTSELLRVPIDGSTLGYPSGMLWAANYTTRETPSAPDQFVSMAQADISDPSELSGPPLVSRYSPDVLRPAAGEPVTVSCADEPIAAARISPDAHWLALVSASGHVCLRDLHTGKTQQLTTTPLAEGSGAARISLGGGGDGEDAPPARVLVLSAGGQARSWRYGDAGWVASPPYNAASGDPGPERADGSRFRLSRIGAHRLQVTGIDDDDEDLVVSKLAVPSGRIVSAFWLDEAGVERPAAGSLEGTLILFDHAGEQASPPAASLWRGLYARAAPFIAAARREVLGADVLVGLRADGTLVVWVGNDPTALFERQTPFNVARALRFTPDGAIEVHGYLGFEDRERQLLMMQHIPLHEPGAGSAAP